MATWILLRDWCRSEDSNLYLLISKQLLLPLKPDRHGGWRGREFGAQPRIVELAPCSARHPHQVIRIVKEQLSPNGETRGKKKPRLHEPTGASHSLVGRLDADSLPTRCSQDYLIIFPAASYDPKLFSGRAKPRSLGCISPRSKSAQSYTARASASVACIRVILADKLCRYVFIGRRTLRSCRGTVNP